jgi:hypothetical protein
MSEVYKLGIFMKFDSLEAVLLGDEAWACELTMDELAFVGGGYGSGYGSAVPAAVYIPQTPQELAIGYSIWCYDNPGKPTGGYYESIGYHQIPQSNGSSSGMYLSASSNASSPSFSLIDSNTGKSMDVSKDLRGIIHVADTSPTPGLTPGEASAACHRLQDYLAEAAKKAPGGFGVEIVVNTLVKELAAFCDHAVDNVDKLYKRSDEAQQVVFHQQGSTQSLTYGYFSNGSGGGSWGSGYGGV